MQNKKGFTLIELMIVVAIIAILAMVAVPMYQRYIERSRNTASQTLLQQLATAEIANQADRVIRNDTTLGDFLSIADATEDGNVTTLLGFGFRPDPNVGFAVLLAPDGAAPGFVAFACHNASGSQMFVYDNINAGGVQIFNPDATYGGVDVPTTLTIFSMDETASTPTLSDDTTTFDVDGNGISQGIS